MHDQRLDVTRPLTPLVEAFRSIDELANSRKLTHEKVKTHDALHRIVASDVYAPMDLPPFSHSQMDGYAVANATGHNAFMKFLEINTGEPLDDEFDTVVPYELAELNGEVMHTKRPLRTGEYVRGKGDDIANNSVVLPAGERIEPVELGLLSSLGMTSVETIRRARISFVVTGDELVAPNESRKATEIFDGNTALVSGLIEKFGGEIATKNLVRDDDTALERAIRDSIASSDITIITGGASVGARDRTRIVLGEMADEIFWRIAFQPGKPTALYATDTTIIFVVPGNPGSVFACMHAFVRRAC